MSYLGIDVGTSGCKAGRFDARGSLLALAYRGYPLITPQIGWAEIDSATVCQSCIEAIREAAAGGPADPVAALAISSQGEAFTPLSADGTCLGNGMVSFDVRSEPFVAEFSRSFGPRRLYEPTGHTPHTMFTLFKLLWLRRHRPEVWHAAAKFYCFEEMLQRRLGLEPAISWPLAGRTMLFNVRTHQWEQEILSAIPLEASRLAHGGLGHGGGHDCPGRCRGVGLAAGGAGRGRGTRSALRRPRRRGSSNRAWRCTRPAPRSASALCSNGPFSTKTSSGATFARTTPRFPERTPRWPSASPAETCWRGSATSGARRRSAKRRETGADPYEVILQGMEAEPTDLFVLPYFTTSGTPYCDPQVPGAILGLRLSTTRGQVLRACWREWPWRCGRMWNSWLASAWWSATSARSAVVRRVSP